MANFLLQWYSIPSRIFARFLFVDTLKQIRRLLEVDKLYPAPHHLRLLQQWAAGIQFLWQHLDQPNVSGLQLPLQLKTIPVIQFDQNPTLFLMMMMSVLLLQILRLFLSVRKIQALRMTMQLHHQLVTLPTLRLHHHQHQLHRMLLLQLLALVILFEDGHKSMTTNSSVSSKMPEHDILGKPSVNAFIVILTAVKLAGTG